MYVTPKGGGEIKGGDSNGAKDATDGLSGNWGEWETQSSQRRAKTSSSKSGSQTISPPVQPSDSPNGGSVVTAVKGVVSPLTASTTPTAAGGTQGGGNVPLATSTPARPQGVQGKSQVCPHVEVEFVCHRLHIYG